MPGPFDGMRNGSLMFGAVARDSSSDNPPLFSQEFAQTLHIFTVNEGNFFTAKTTALFSKKAGVTRSFFIFIPLSGPRRWSFSSHHQFS